MGSKQDRLQPIINLCDTIITMNNKKTFEDTKDGLIVRIKVIPNSSKNELVITDDGLKLKITAQPIENKANKAVIEFVSKKLKTAKSNIKIIKGELSKEKTLLISNYTEELFTKILVP